MKNAQILNKTPNGVYIILDSWSYTSGPDVKALLDRKITIFKELRVYKLHFVSGTELGHCCCSAQDRTFCCSVFIRAASR